MPEKLTELLLRIVASSCGIEEEQSFFTAVLSEIHQCFQPMSTQLFQLFIRTGGEDTYEQLACYPAHPQIQGIFLSAPTDTTVDACLPSLRETPKGTQLLLPMKDDKSPMMLLCLSWKNPPPPDWIRDEELMIVFNKKFGSYLPWKRVMLKIAAAKRHLETIFDHLPCAVSVIDADCTIERVNKAFTRLFDIPFGEAVGKKFNQVVDHEVSPDECRDVQRAVGKGDKVSLEARNGNRLQVSFLPLAAHDSRPGSMQIFRSMDVMDGYEKAIRDYDFWQLYDSLSRPLTVLSLTAGMISAKSERRITSEYLGIIRKEISTVMDILKEAHSAATALVQKTLLPGLDVF